MARSPRVPFYSLHKPSGRAYVRVADASTGARRTLYLGEHGSPENRESYAKIIADLLAGRTITPPQVTSTAQLEPSITVGALAAKYELHARDYYRKNGRPTCEVHSIHRAVEFLTANHAGLPAGAFSIGDLKAVREAMVKTSLSRSTVNKYVDRVRRAFKWGAAEELIPPEVAQALILLPGLP